MSAALQIAGIGHNLPELNLERELDPEVLAIWLDGQFADRVKRRDELLAAHERFKSDHPTIESDDVCGKAADFIQMCSVAISTTEARHKTVKAPVLRAYRLCDEKLAGITDPLKEAKRAVDAKKADYLRAKEEAVRAQARAEAEAKRREADRLAAAAQTDPDAFDAAIAASERADQAEAIAAAPAAALVRTRGDLGGVATLRSNWTARVTDMRALLAAILDGKADISLVLPNESVLKAMARSTKDPSKAPAGVQFYNDRR